MGNKNIRAVCILFNEDKVLLIEREKEGEKYFVFPGGGVEENEDIEEAVLRELKEETSIKAKINKLLYVHDYGSSEQLYYLCQYINGEPKLRNDAIEKERMAKGNDFYKPRWVEVSKLPELLLYPLEIKDWLIKDLRAGFPNKPRVAKLKIEELRQEL